MNPYGYNRSYYITPDRRKFGHIPASELNKLREHWTSIRKNEAEKRKEFRDRAEKAGFKVLGLFCVFILSAIAFSSFINEEPLLICLIFLLFVLPIIIGINESIDRSSTVLEKPCPPDHTTMIKELELRELDLKYRSSLKEYIYISHKYQHIVDCPYCSREMEIEAIENLPINYKCSHCENIFIVAYDQKKEKWYSEGPRGGMNVERIF